jgi:hypothetical protein
MITEDSLCHLQCSLAAKYKKVSPTLKKSSIMVSDYVEKQGLIKADMVEVYKIPLLASELALTLSKDTPVKMIDEYKQFYLIELTYIFYIHKDLVSTILGFFLAY